MNVRHLHRWNQHVHPQLLRCAMASSFSGTNCDQCAAGKGCMNGVCAMCANPQWNNEATHKATHNAPTQTCIEGDVPVTSDNAVWKTTGGNCEVCGAGFASPSGTAQCADID
jgi:hypothetical protein